MEIGLVKTIDIDQEMQQAYLDYAMSVIVSRALPDARDGLKPVHRRIMYAMYDMGLRPDTSYKKSARIVGEVLGKYHPHGDAAVYDAMARLAQDFSTRYPLVDGQGNFGSMDGDPPAAMRYTEARMDSLASDLLTDIQKDTVDFTPNFDDTLEEPIVLPASFPNLLVNGATGIAVGMSTSIPPHNLGEVVDALIYMLNNWSKLDDINVDDLMKFIKGPDFPTGGVIIIPSSKEDALKTSYGTGRGRITVQSRAHVEEMDRGRKRVIVTELPYMTNKTSLLERIAKLVRDGKLEGVSDLRDETDREGMRIVIELTKGTDPEELLRKLYRSTTMQGTFSIINLALVDGEPRLLGLKQALRVYLEHRHTVVRRRSEHDLNKSRERAHILEGLIIALKNLDEIIDTIRRSRTVESARNNLRRNFSLSESQAQAILNMPLRRLASLEQKKIDQEYKDVVKQIKFLERLLRSPKKIRDVISNELQKVKEVYGDPRRTRIVYLDEGETKTSLLTARDIAPDKNVWVSITTEGLISRTQEDKLPRLSGSAAPEWLVRVNTRDTLYLVAENGTAAGIGVHSIPEADKPTEGIEFTRISPLDQNDKLTAAFNLLPKDQRSVGWYVVTVTKEGLVKKSEITDLPGATAQSFILARVNEGDAIKWVHISDGKSDILLATKNGLAIRFSEEDVRPMGLVAAGVMGIKLKKGDEVIGAEIIDSDKKSKNRDVFLIRNDSQAKRVKIDQFPTQGRYGQGVIAWKLPNKTNLAGMTIGKYTQRIILHLHELTAKSVRLDSAPIRTRPSNGNSVIDLKEGDWITKLSVPYDFPRPEIEIERKKSKGKRKGKTKKRRQKNK